MELKFKTVSNEIYKAEIHEPLENFFKEKVLGNGYLMVLDTIKRPTWINVKYIEAVTVMEDKND